MSRHEQMDANVLKMAAGMSMTPFNLYKEAWEGWSDDKKEQKQDTSNPFLAPLMKGVSAIGDACWQQMEDDITAALKKSIY